MSKNPYTAVDPKLVAETKDVWKAKGLKAINSEIDKTSKELKDVLKQAGEDLDISKVEGVVGSGSPAEKAENTTKLHAHLSGLEDAKAELVQLKRDMEMFEDHGSINGPSNVSFDRAFSDEPQGIEAMLRNEVYRKIGGNSLRDFATTSQDNSQNQFTVQAKDLIFSNADTTAGPAASNSYPTQIVRSDVVVPAVLRPIQVMDVLNPTLAASNGGGFSYMQSKTHTSSAKVVTQGAASDEATYEWEEVQVPFIKVAAHVPVTEELMMDAAMVSGMVQSNLVGDVRRFVDDQVVGGSGTGNMAGFAANSNATSKDLNLLSAGVTNAVFDDIEDAKRQCRVDQRSNPNLLFLHSSVASIFRTIKNSDGDYYMGGPLMQAAQERVFGLPIVETEAGIGNYFKRSATPSANDRVGAVVDTSLLRVMINPNAQIAFGLSSDDFVKGKLTIRCIVRANVMNLRPAATIVLKTKLS